MQALKTFPVVMSDADAMTLAADPLMMTTLAVELEVAMLTNASARDAYARIYGREWQSLADVQSADAIESARMARGTGAHTVR
jgi:hypothetical protein